MAQESVGGRGAARPSGLLAALALAGLLSSACSTSVRFGGKPGEALRKDAAASDGGGGNGNGYDGKISHVTRGECGGIATAEKSALAVGGARPLLVKENCRPLVPAREIDSAEIEAIAPGGRVLAYRGTIYDKKSAVATEQLVTIAACRARGPHAFEALVWTKAGDPSHLSGELFKTVDGVRDPSGSTGTLGVSRRYDRDSGLEKISSEMGRDGEFFQISYVPQGIEASFRMAFATTDEFASEVECMRQEPPRLSINVVSMGHWHHRKAGGRR